MEHNDFYAAIVRNNSDAIISHDLDGNIKRWNLGAELLIGLSEEQMKGQPINSLFTDDNRKLYWRQVGKLVRDRSASTSGVFHTGVDALRSVQLPFEMQLLRSNKTLLPVSVTVSDIGGQAKGTVEICLIARDISRQKEAEEHINELYNTVSHELRTPLTSLQGALSILDEGMMSLDTNDAREMVRVAREGCDELLKIVSDILDFRRLESNEAPLSLSVVRAEEVIDQSILAVKSLADKRDVEIIKAVAQESFVSADKDRIIQVLVNFLKNAINYSPSPGKVQVLAVLRRSGGVRISVIDDGPGISPEDGKRIFQKFQRIDPCSTRTLRGTGLGLATCKLIMDQHEGAIGFDTVLGKGTAFWIELKALGASSRQAGTVVAHAVKNCLIVSEDRQAVEALHKFLTKRGIGCRLVQAADVIAVVRSHKPHAVLLDLASLGPDIFNLILDVEQVSDAIKTIVFRRSSKDDLFSHPSRIDCTVHGGTSLEEKTRAVVDLQKHELKCCVPQEDFLAEALNWLK